MSSHEAFLLLTLRNVTFITPQTSQTGWLGLECVTVTATQDIFLVLRLGTFEIPIDPARTIAVTAPDPSRRVYQFHGTPSDPSEFSLSIPSPPPDHAEILEDLQTFESVLSQYAELRGNTVVPIANPFSPDAKSDPLPPPLLIPPVNTKGADDLHGRLVLVNQDNGEIVGEFDHKFKVEEDPNLGEKGHENDPVVIEIPEGENGLTPLQAFAQAIPPDQQDWMTKSATVVSHVISHSTSLLVTVITSASSYYISHSKPSTATSPVSSGKSISGASTSTQQSRAATFLTSDRTRQNLATVHAFSGQAVKVSSKTLSVIDGLIHKAVGKKPKQPKHAQTTLAPASSSYSGSRSPSPSPTSYSAPPPPYHSGPSLSGYTSPSGSEYLTPTLDGKPPLPPRRSASPAPYSPVGGPPPVIRIPEQNSPSSSVPAPPPLPPRQLRTRDRLLLSADLIFSTIDDSTKQLLDVSTDRVGAVVGHKYGDDAGHSARLTAGTARNLAVVYVDMKGIGRKALIKRVGKEYVKAKVSSSK